MNIFSIGFDEGRKLEFFSPFVPIKFKGESEYRFISCDPIAKPMGSLILEFINLDLNNKTKTQKFIFQYLLGYYMLEYCHFGEELEYKISFSKKELNFYVEDAYFDLQEELKKLQEDFISSINHTFSGVEHLIKKNHKEGNFDVDYSDCFLAELYATLYEYSEDIFVDFDLPTYCYLPPISEEGDDPIDANVELAFASETFGNILFIALRKLIFQKNILILRCEYCHDYFIPDSLHYQKYCNKVHKNGKTCKSLGALVTYKNKLKNDPILKKYNSRYSSLASNASNYPDNPVAVKRFDDYKQKGSQMRHLYLEDKISKNEFEKWIESTRVRKNRI